MNLTKILTFVLMAVSLYLFYYLYNSIQTTIDDGERIAATEAAVIDRLKLIREAEILFQESTGRYTTNWDSLITFVEQGQIPIVERREEIIQKPYGGEEVILHLDTLGFVSAKERIFKKSYTVNAPDNGIFMGYKVQLGDQVIKNQKAYSLKTGDKVSEPPFIENGIISSLADLKTGQEVKKGTTLINMWNYQFKPDVDLKRLAIKPGTENTKFDIFVGEVDKGGIKVDVIEVKDPSPDNPIRKESNDSKTRKPLRFGSRTDVSTAGNWES